MRCTDDPHCTGRGIEARAAALIAAEDAAAAAAVESEPAEAEGDGIGGSTRSSAVKPTERATPPLYLAGGHVSASVVAVSLSWSAWCCPPGGRLSLSRSRCSRCRAPASLLQPIHHESESRVIDETASDTPAISPAKRAQSRAL